MWGRGALSGRAITMPSMCEKIPYILQPTSIFFGWNTNIPELYLQIHLTSYSHWLQRSILYEQFTVSSPDEVNILACCQARHVSFYVRSSGLWVRVFVGVWIPYQGGRGFIGWTDAPQPKRTLFTLWADWCNFCAYSGRCMKLSGINSHTTMIQTRYKTHPAVTLLDLGEVIKGRYIKK